MKDIYQVLWERHLSSVQKIVDTTVEIVRGRKKPHLANKCFYPFFRLSETALSLFAN